MKEIKNNVAGDMYIYLDEEITAEALISEISKSKIPIVIMINCKVTFENGNPPSGCIFSYNNGLFGVEIQDSLFYGTSFGEKIGLIEYIKNKLTQK